MNCVTIKCEKCQKELEIRCCNSCGGKVSVQPDVGNLPNVQRTKLQFLLARGAKVKSARLLIQTPSGLCTLDDFGRVEWITPETSGEE